MTEPSNPPPASRAPDGPERTFAQNGYASSSNDRLRDSRLLLFGDILYILTWRDIKIRYKQSIMGMMWAVFMPSLIVLAGLLMRLAMTEIGGTKLTTADVASLSIKALPWAFFVGGLRFASMSLVSNSNLITKIRIPRIVFPISAVLSSFFDLLIAAVPLTLVLAVCGVRLNLALLWAPVLVGLLVLLVTGLGIALAVGNLFLRDVKYIVEVILTFAIFFTPVLYEVRMLGDLGTWVLLNPVAPLLEGLSALVRGESPQVGWVVYSAMVSTGAFATSWVLFTYLEGMFADYL